MNCLILFYIKVKYNKFNLDLKSINYYKYLIFYKN